MKPNQLYQQTLRRIHGRSCSQLSELYSSKKKFRLTSRAFTRLGYVQIYLLPFLFVCVNVVLMRLWLFFQAVDNLCLHKLDGKLYDQIEKECEEHISAALQSLVGQNTDLTVFLSRVEKCWQDFCDQMLMIRSIALTLDRKYVIQNPNVRSLWEMGLQLFRKHLSLAPEVEQRTVKGLLSMIEKER